MKWRVWRKWGWVVLTKMKNYFTNSIYLFWKYHISNNKFPQFIWVWRLYLNGWIWRRSFESIIINPPNLFGFKKFVDVYLKSLLWFLSYKFGTRLTHLDNWFLVIETTTIHLLRSIDWNPTPFTFYSLYFATAPNS